MSHNNKTSANLLIKDNFCYESFQGRTIKLNEMIDNCAEKIDLAKTNVNRNLPKKDKFQTEKFRLANCEEQVNRLTDLLAIIFNSYRIIDDKNKLIRNLKLRLETANSYNNYKNNDKLVFL